MAIAVTISYDDDSGEMTRFTLSPAFRRESLLLQVDVLYDICGAAKDALDDAFAALDVEDRERRAARGLTDDDL